MLVEQCLWSPVPSSGLHHGQRQDRMESVLIQNPPDYTLLDPAPLSVQEKLIAPMSDSGIAHAIEAAVPPAKPPVDVRDISEGHPLHSILHKTLSRKSLVATVQLSVSKEGSPPTEQSRTKNFGSSLFEVFDADSASEYSDDGSYISNHSVRKPSSDADAEAKHFIALPQAPTSSRTPLFASS